MDQFQDSNAERFCSKHAFRLPVGDKSDLVYWAADRSAATVPHHVAVLLDQCRTFKTLDAHAVNCANEFKRRGAGAHSPGIESIKKHLSALAEAGLLISENAVLEVCRQQAHPTPPKIATVGVITRNRTESLGQCLTSFVDNSQRFKRDNDFVVMDDSEDPRIRAVNKELLQFIKRKQDVGISYAGREEKTLFASALIA